MTFVKAFVKNMAHLAGRSRPEVVAVRRSCEVVDRLALDNFGDFVLEILLFRRRLAVRVGAVSVPFAALEFRALGKKLLATSLDTSKCPKH